MGDLIATFNRKPKGKTEREHRINEEIDSSSVRLVSDGEPVVVSRETALEMAVQKGLDLVEISNQDMPVVRIMDYSKFRFEQVKKAKEAKKKQKVIHIKEVKMRPGIDDNDYSHKLKHAREFLENGDKVKVTMMFRGREIVYTDLGLKVMDKILADLKDCAATDMRPKIEGKNMTMFLNPVAAPVVKKKIESTESEETENA